MASEIKFEPSVELAKYQLSQQFDRKAWVLGLNETLMHDDTEYRLDLHITVLHGREALYIMTPRLSEMGSAYPIVTMKDYLDWHECMVDNEGDEEQQLRHEIKYVQTHWIMEHKSCPLPDHVLLKWYQLACDMANHMKAIINLGLIGLHVTM